jgi:hypothetical protein
MSEIAETLGTHLQHTCIAIATYETLDLLLQHLDKNMQHPYEIYI